jgi:hypothetical protein
VSQKAGVPACTVTSLFEQHKHQPSPAGHQRRNDRSGEGTGPFIMDLGRRVTNIGIHLAGAFSIVFAGPGDSRLPLAQHLRTTAWRPP